MTPDDARHTLLAAAKLRMPKFDQRDGPGARIKKLEDYLLQTASTGADLEEARLHMQMALHALQEKWDAIPSAAWEIHAPAEGRARTKESIRQAKRLIGPDEEALYQGIIEATFLIARLTEQIQRLCRMGDDQVASRIYTMLAGA